MKSGSARSISEDGRAFRRSARGPAPGRAGRGTRAVGQTSSCRPPRNGWKLGKHQDWRKRASTWRWRRRGSIWRKRDAMCLPGGSSLPRSGGRPRPRFASVAGELDATPGNRIARHPRAAGWQSNPRLARFGAEVAQREAGARTREGGGRSRCDVARRLLGRSNETKDVTAVVGFSLPLPLWNRNQRKHPRRAGAD